MTTTTSATAIVQAERDADREGGSIAAFSSTENFETAQRMANALSKSNMVPEVYRGNISNVLVAMELASRTGASLFAVMQNIDIIHGRPSWRATFLIATVNACGRFTPLRFRWSGETGTDSWGCRAVAKDIDSGEECLGALITIALAKAEGWATKSGSKWKTMPEQMLMYRAAAFWTRVYAPEQSLGMHTTDEIADAYASSTAPTALVELPPALQPGSVKSLEEDLLSDQTPVADADAVGEAS